MYIIRYVLTFALCLEIYDVLEEREKDFYDQKLNLDFWTGVFCWYIEVVIDELNIKLHGKNPLIPDTWSTGLIVCPLK